MLLCNFLTNANTEQKKVRKWNRFQMDPRKSKSDQAAAEINEIFCFAQFE